MHHPLQNVRANRLYSLMAYLGNINLVTPISASHCDTYLENNTCMAKVEGSGLMAWCKTNCDNWPKTVYRKVRLDPKSPSLVTVIFLLVRQATPPLFYPKMVKYAIVLYHNQLFLSLAINNS